MGNSLQEQLLKAGLADKNKLHKVTQEKRKKLKQQSKKKPPDDENKLKVQQAMDADKACDQELNRRKAAAAQAREMEAQIKQLVTSHQLPLGDGSIGYHFQDNHKIKTLYVAETLRKKIIQGQVAIVRAVGGYALVPKDTAEKIRARDAAWVVVLNEAAPAPADDDPYAAYQVPDDLMW